MNLAVEGVPTSEMLRQAALQASWRRDRHVGPRRIRWRWFAWGATRWAMPVLAAAILGYVPMSVLLPSGPPAQEAESLVDGWKLSTFLPDRLTQPVPQVAPPSAADDGIALKTDFRFNIKEKR